MIRFIRGLIAFAVFAYTIYGAVQQMRQATRRYRTTDQTQPQKQPAKT